MNVDGTLGPFPELDGTDLALDAQGPDASFMGVLAGTDVPAEPFLMRGGARGGRVLRRGRLLGSARIRT